MSYESGSISFRMMELPRPFPEDFAARFAADKAGPIEAVKEGIQRGWVTGRHLLDSGITKDSALFGGYLRLSLRQAERKIPAALLKAECRQEELAVMAAEGKAYLKHKQRAEIRQAIAERLLPTMPPQISAIPFIYRPGFQYLFVSAVSDPHMDVFCSALQHSLGFFGSSSTPEVLASHMGYGDIRELAAAGFVPGGALFEHTPGRDFLTWLWYMSEANNGKIRLPDRSDIGVMVEGPLTFMHEGTGAYSAVLKKGLPENSAEAKTCLMGGKKLKEAKITFYFDEDRQWRFSMEADKFVFRCMKLPSGEGKMDAVSRFQERISSLEQWRDAFLGIYTNFLETRTDRASWKATTKNIQDWIQSRPART